MPTANIIRDGKIVRSTTLTAADAEKFTILARAISDAQAVLRTQQGADASIYAVLPRLAELLGKHARAVFSHLDEAISGEVLRNTDGTAKAGNMLVTKNTPIPAPFHPAQALAAQAVTLGMVMADSSKFDFSELLSDPVPPVIANGIVVKHVPQSVMAYVRFFG